jgi:uncharacterized repeat protein (TIGR01451 family)
VRENNRTQDVDGISTVPDLDLGVSYDRRTPYPGKVITYTLRYTNTSAMDTIGVVITATRSAGLTGTPPGWTKSGPSDWRSIGNLAAGKNGSVTYVLKLPSTYTPAMRAFTVTFTIQDGGPGGLPKAQDQKTPLIGVPDLSITRVIVPSVVAGQKFTATVIISNGGLGVACNPKYPVVCGPFAIDIFIAPRNPPKSYPFGGYGDTFTPVPVLSPGQVTTVTFRNLQFAPNQTHLLYFKVDNWDCADEDPCLPSGSQGGQVPEYDESNNVFPPPRVYLPLVQKNRP